MKCPKCGRKMLDGPCMDYQSKHIRYKLCLWCFPLIRILVWCEHIKEIVMISMMKKEYRTALCRKSGGFCRLESDPETGYVYCPQIREFQYSDWAKKANKEFEERMKNKNMVHE